MSILIFDLNTGYIINDQHIAPLRLCVFFQFNELLKYILPQN